MSWLLNGLNPAQREAVETVEGPLLIIAGAGSGKTRVLTSRLAYILSQRLAEPYQLLAVTFTNKAAGEMRLRVNQLLGTELPELQVSTFHSFCARLLRRDSKAIGYDSNFTIFDDADSQTLAKNCIRELGFSDGQFPARGQMRKISDAKNKLISSESFAASASGYFETRTAEIYKLYQRRLRECNAMDFDDLLCNAVWLLRDVPEVGDRYRRRFKYLLVDEYQDTNHVQYLLLKQLLGDHDNICVVGDEDQSIYGWRGADIRNILDFEKDFPRARVIKLEQNYRSTSVILSAASAVIRNNQMRKGKTLWTSVDGGDKLTLLLVDSADDEAAHVVDRLSEVQRGSSLKETVILYRTNGQSRPFEEQLRRRNIPYQIIGGVSFYQRKEVKDLMAYLKLLVNPADDIAFGRVINFPKRGIGDKTISEIQQVAGREKISCYATVVRSSEFPELAAKAKRLEPFVQLLEKYRERTHLEPVDIITQDLVTDLGLITELLADDPIQGQTRVESVEAFIEGTVEFAKGHPEAKLVDYLNDISLFTDLDTYKEIEDKITLMTIHAAKGLEFENVFLVGLEEGLFPLQRAAVEPDELEEERRLFYVGATRAKKKIYLSSASTRFRFGEVESIPSRFIKEIPAELVERIDYRKSRYMERDSSQMSFAPTRKQSTQQGVHYEYEEHSVFRAGRIVEHPTFGRGRIVTVEGFGESLRLEIAFTGVGTKKIMAKFAKLRVVG
jgi:DNA helicase II / ATP-dependent DNA helicase PcrA